VRIIAGEFKGFRLETPSADVAHVMGERERGAVFNALFDVSGLRVLDCFAGSGALGFEALSRGALVADFVENNKRVRAIIAANASRLDVESRVGTLIGLPVEAGQYDLIFSDAPYDNPQWELVATLAGLLDKGGRLVISHAKTTPIPDVVVQGLKKTYSKTFAGAQLDIFTK